MLIDDIIIVKIGGKNVNYYNNLNYNCNVGDLLEINTTELPNNSKVIVKVKCDICNTIKEIEYRSYIKNIKKYPIYCCNTSCAKIKENKTKLELYGEYYEKNRVITMKKTNKLKYGNEKTSQIFRNEKDNEKFINELKLIYGDFFDFNNIKYINNYTKVTIICPIHGEFNIRPIELLSGQGCSKCNRNLVQKKTLDKYLEICNNIHNNKYDYSNIDFKNLSSKVKIICPTHGEFKQSLHLHSMKRGCPKCANINRRLKRIANINQNLKNGYQITPAFNNKACLVFDDISRKNNIHIQHAMNGGEYYISALGYWLDGYDIVNNVAYEYDEKAHFINGKLKQKDINRQYEIQNYLKCKFIRIKE